MEKNGFETKQYVASEDIARIQISKFYDTEEETISVETTVGFSEVVATSSEGQTCLEEYVDANEIEEIMKHAYPASLPWEYWYRESPFDEANHSITVYFKEGTKMAEEYSYVADFYFLKDEVPSFVLEDLPKDTVPEK